LFYIHLLVGVSARVASGAGPAPSLLTTFGATLLSQDVFPGREGEAVTPDKSYMLEELGGELPGIRYNSRSGSSRLTSNHLTVVIEIAVTSLRLLIYNLLRI
jgi:hypothetical protein